MPLNRHKPLYQPWSEEEFVSDFNVRNMTHLQRWMYRSLLQSMFFCSTRPYLPDSDSVLWMMAGCESKQQWTENKKEILKNFTKLTKDGHKMLSQKRVELDYAREQNRREVLKEKGSKGGRSKGKKTEAAGKPQLSSAISAPSTELDCTGLNQTEPDQPNDTGRSPVDALQEYVDKVS